MPIKIYVDDLRPTPNGWVGIRTVTEAIRLLCTQEVEAISLDHDIMHTVPSKDPCIPISAKLTGEELHEVSKIGYTGISVPVACLETYEALAWFLAFCKPELRPERIYIHTANPLGEKKMREILASQGIESPRLPLNVRG